MRPVLFSSGLIDSNAEGATILLESANLYSVIDQNVQLISAKFTIRLLTSVHVNARQVFIELLLAFFMKNFYRECRYYGANVRQSDLKPAFLCDPSQKGLFADSPHRHSARFSPCQALRPLAAINDTLPSISKGPSLRGLMLSFPPVDDRPGPFSPTAP